MDAYSLIHTFFLIFSSIALLATFILFAKQPIIVTYIVAGMVLGPHGIKMVHDTNLLHDISQAGIILLLFLLGLEMHPRHLGHLLKRVAISGLTSSVIFAGIGYACARLFHFSYINSVIVGISMMFSSTIIGIKLLPTTVLHNKHKGELLISQLLLQDLLAIIVLLCLYNSAAIQHKWPHFLLVFSTLPVFIIIVFLLVKFVLLPLMLHFSQYQEYLFLLAIGWCMGIAQLASYVELSSEIGAFIAGVCIATSQFSESLSDKLKPIRDFFLVLFFFSTGAGFNIHLLTSIWPEVLLLTFLCITIKPVIFGLLLKRQNEKERVAWEVGLRLGQNSEFSILIAMIASSHALITQTTSSVIQATTVITLVISSYLVVFNLPSPIAVSNQLRQD